jgi:hypothetical protein
MSLIFRCLIYSSDLAVLNLYLQHATGKGRFTGKVAQTSD